MLASERHEAIILVADDTPLDKALSIMRDEVKRGWWDGPSWTNSRPSSVATSRCIRQGSVAKTAYLEA